MDPEIMASFNALFNLALIVFFFVGFVRIARRFKIKELTANECPNVTPEIFVSWQKLELKSLTVFLWSTYGVIAVKWLWMLLETKHFMSRMGYGASIINDSTINIGLLAFWLIGLIISSVYGIKASAYGIKANKLKKSS